MRYAQKVEAKHRKTVVKTVLKTVITVVFNPLSTSPTKWSNTL